jgi:D-arabinose 1-dehydrogenase-like Zn-dependent alcohol dehydrogenase
MPGLSYPRIPGHEVIGVIDALGPEPDDRAIDARRTDLVPRHMQLKKAKNLAGRGVK